MKEQLQLEFELLSDPEQNVQFIYHYDGDAETKVPIPSDQDRVRVADIHGGPGERITIGFETDLPDEDFAISAIELRWRALGKSEER